jgi:hypothetical protein
MVTSTTLSSMKIVAGTKRITAIGAMYMSRFMELIFSLGDRQTDITGFQLSVTENPIFLLKKSERERERHVLYPSEDIRIPCKTVLSALAAVAPTHMMNPKR